MYFVYSQEEDDFEPFVKLFHDSEDAVPYYAESFPQAIYFQGELIMTDEGFNIFDGAQTTPVVEDQIVLVEWNDNTESVLGPYTPEEARSVGEDLQATNDKLKSWTIVPLVKP